MKITVGELKGLIHEVAADCWGGSRPEETYDELLEDDPTYRKKSKLVPDDVKHSISAWMKKMGLAK